MGSRLIGDWRFGASRISGEMGNWVTGYRLGITEDIEFGLRDLGFLWIRVAGGENWGNWGFRVSNWLRELGTMKMKCLG